MPELQTLRYRKPEVPTRKYFTSAQSAKHAKDALKGELEEDLRRSTAGVSQAAEPQEKFPRVEAAAQSSFMQEFDQIVEECEDPGAASSSSPAVQLHGYLAEKTLASSDNPYQYWGVNKDRFPCLAATATKYLCAPCTSVVSERVFSTVSNIVDEKRSRLTAESKNACLHEKEFAIAD
ncbi:zinc finger BED domain-containing protein 4-like [Pseudorasbora parva]|uniref:zinc finger BED domain-containing protein 4-like n=1 Tax=Pseudorasbora parva TaxID=51549 RepID=UPI00351DD931